MIFFLAEFHHRPTEDAVLIGKVLLVLPFARGGVRLDLLCRDVTNGNSIEMPADVVFLCLHDRCDGHIMRPAGRDDDAGDKPETREHLVNEFKPLRAVRDRINAADDVRSLHRRGVKHGIAQIEFRLPARNAAARNRRDDDTPLIIVCRRVVNILLEFLMCCCKFNCERIDEHRLGQCDSPARNRRLLVLYVLLMFCRVEDVH